jgi:branched-subunit amino acid transport protein
MEFFETHDLHLTGLLIGVFTFLIIGIFHPIVIKAEYYFGVRCWWCFLLAGVAGVAGALCIRDVLWSSTVGVFAFSCFWSIKELFDQRKRVSKGWFPRREKKEN